MEGAGGMLVFTRPVLDSVSTLGKVEEGQCEALRTQRLGGVWGMHLLPLPSVASILFGVGSGGSMAGGTTQSKQGVAGQVLLGENLSYLNRKWASTRWFKTRNTELPHILSAFQPEFLVCMTLGL